VSLSQDGQWNPELRRQVIRPAAHHGRETLRWLIGRIRRLPQSRAVALGVQPVTITAARSKAIASLVGDDACPNLSPSSWGEFAAVALATNGLNSNGADGFERLMGPRHVGCRRHIPATIKRRFDPRRLPCGQHAAAGGRSGKLGLTIDHAIGGFWVYWQTRRNERRCCCS
jgi:hypothetical protein